MLYMAPSTAERKSTQLKETGNETSDTVWGLAARERCVSSTRLQPGVWLQHKSNSVGVILFPASKNRQLSQLLTCSKSKAISGGMITFKNRLSCSKRVTNTAHIIILGSLYLCLHFMTHVLTGLTKTCFKKKQHSVCPETRRNLHKKISSLKIISSPAQRLITWSALSLVCCHVLDLHCTPWTLHSCAQS